MKLPVMIPMPWQHRMNRDLALLVFVVVACAIPFIFQPFHMDDNFYMDMARNARVHPLFPYDAPYSFGGFHLRDMASHSHPPLQAYFLALIQSVAGEGEGREWAYHLASLIFPLLASLSMYFIAGRYVDRPIWPALALAVSPLFLVMGHTLMTDVPMLALWLAAVACLLWAVDLDWIPLYAASSFFLFAAMFTSYQSVALVPLLGYYLLRRRSRPAGWAWLMLAPAAMGAWLAVTSGHYGRLVLGDTIGYVQSRQAATIAMLGTKALALLEYQGWLVIFPVFLLYSFARGLKGRLLGLVVIASVLIAQGRVTYYRPLDKAIFVAGLATGIFVVGKMLGVFLHAFFKPGAAAEGWRRLDMQFLALWYCGIAAYCLLLFTEGSARYILPLVPPVLIVFFKGIERDEVAEYRAESRRLLSSSMVASGSLVLTLAWGLFLAQADYEFAGVYPRAAASFSRMFPGYEAYVAGEWGFRYYLGFKGARPIPPDEAAVDGGSLVITPKLAMPYSLPGGLDSMTSARPLARLSFDLKTPLRIMDAKAPAGFYSTGWGLIPFSFSDAALETIEIRQVNYMIANLPSARIECEAGVLPWPGYVWRSERSLAVLAKPGTRIVYPWTFPHAATLGLGIGVVREAPRSEDQFFDFEVLCRDAQGHIRSRYAKTLTPGMAKENDPWYPIRLALPASAAGGETLEFSYRARGAGETVGAFVEAVITPPEFRR
jgi:4-amino-4-deoxy-L-arabinose transferase-like glycosyltransferase